VYPISELTEKEGRMLKKKEKREPPHTKGGKHVFSKFCLNQEGEMGGHRGWENKSQAWQYKGPFFKACKGKEKINTFGNIRVNVERD